MSKGAILNIISKYTVIFQFIKCEDPDFSDPDPEGYGSETWTDPRLYCPVPVARDWDV